MPKKKRKTVGTYNPYKNALMEEGVYPAHIISFDERAVDTRFGQAFVYSLRYRIAPEAAKQQQTLWKRANNGHFAKDDAGERIPERDKEDNIITISCGNFAGRELYSNGIFLFVEEEASGRNRAYSNLLDVVGIKLEEVEIQKGVVVKQLVQLEENDVLGKPALVKVAYRSFVTRETRELPKEDQDVRWAARVLEVYPWEDGKPIPLEEIEREELPF